MSNWQRKARPGDPLRVSAAAYNKFIDTAVAVDARTFAGQPGAITRSNTIILAVNDGESPCDAFTPYRITGVESPSIERRDAKAVIRINGDGSGAVLTDPTFVVPQEAIRPGNVGKVAVSGWTYCRVRDLPGEEMPPGTRLGISDGMLVPDAIGAATLIHEGVGDDAESGDDATMALVVIGLIEGEFYAKLGLTAEQDGTAARWLYAWDEVSWDSESSEWDQVDGGRSWSVWGRARNLLETSNTAASAYSIPVAGQNFEIGNTGVRFREVPPGTIVRVSIARSTDGLGLPTFSAPNPVWGPCTALAELAESIGSQSDSGNPLPSSEEQESEETS